MHIITSWVCRCALRGDAEELLDQGVEFGRPLDLRPVAATGEHMEIAVREEMDHVPRHVHRDHPVLTAMHQKRRCGDRTDLLLGDRQFTAGVVGLKNIRW